VIIEEDQVVSVMMKDAQKEIGEAVAEAAVSEEVEATEMMTVGTWDVLTVDNGDEEEKEKEVSAAIVMVVVDTVEETETEEDMEIVVNATQEEDSDVVVVADSGMMMVDSLGIDLAEEEEEEEEDIRLLDSGATEIGEILRIPPQDGAVGDLHIGMNVLLT